MFKTLGRLLVRKNKTCGLFIPFEKNGLKSGIYELREIMDEVTLVYIGKPAMGEKRYEGIGVQDLVKNHNASMTKKEIKQIVDEENRFKKALEEL